MSLPEEVRQADEDGERGAGPEPRREEGSALTGQEKAAEDSCDVEGDGVLGHEAEAGEDAYGEPPAWVFGFEQAEDAVGDEEPPEEVEGGVLELGALEERDGGESDGEGGGDLREAAATELEGHEAGEDDGNGLR